MQDNSTFGNRLRNARKRANLTGKEVASSVGVSYPSYMAYENQGREPKQETLAKLSDVLGVSIDYLIKGPQPQIWPRDITKIVDIAPMFDDIADVLLENKEVYFEDKELDNTARKNLFLAIAFIRAIIAIGDTSVLAHLFARVMEFSDKVEKIGHTKKPPKE